MASMSSVGINCFLNTAPRHASSVLCCDSSCVFYCTSSSDTVSCSLSSICSSSLAFIKALEPNAPNPIKLARFDQLSIACAQKQVLQPLILTKLAPRGSDHDVKLPSIPLVLLIIGHGLIGFADESLHRVWGFGCHDLFWEILSGLHRWDVLAVLVLKA